MASDAIESYDVFLSHGHHDANIVELLGKKLEDEAKLRVWLDKWVLVPGEHWQQQMARGLEHAKTCAVCISQKTPDGWFREEIEKALQRQTTDRSFRVIPVILPGGNSSVIDSFLDLRTWVDFNRGIDDAYATHLLVSGIQGKAPGRWPANSPSSDSRLEESRARLQIIVGLRGEKLIDDSIALEYQRRVLDSIFK